MARLEEVLQQLADDGVRATLADQLATAGHAPAQPGVAGVTEAQVPA